MQIQLTAIVTLLLATLPSHAEDQVLSTNVDRTDVNLFLPDGVKHIRAVFINPADNSVGAGVVWSESCRHWSMAHMGVMLENVDKRNNRPTTIKKVIDAALKEFAAKSGHPELATTPFLFGGMSKGGGWSAEIGQDLGPRTIAFNNVCGWVGKPEKDLSMPAAIIIGGTPDGFKMLDAISTQYEPARKKGANWCLALQWGNAHNYGNANALSVPFFDAVIAARLGNGPLKDMPLDQCWLGDRTTWESNRAAIASHVDYTGDRQAASWLPNRYVAHVWRSFVSKDPPVQLNVATIDGRIAAPRFKATEKRSVIVPFDALLNLRPDFASGTQVREVAFYDGDIRLGQSSEAPFTFTWRDLPAGPRSVYAEYTLADGTVGVSNPVLVLVRRKP